MTPEAEEHLDKAREALIKARGLLDVMHYSDEAARAAYLAGFHAAQALISERTGRIAKSHSGVRSAFARLVRLSENWRHRGCACFETRPSGAPQHEGCF